MGFFKKAKEAAQQAQQAFAPPQGDGRVHVQGAGLIDPSFMGGPSTRSVAADDPIWQPINGISLQDYAELAREAQARGINDEAGMITLVPGARVESGGHQGGARRLGAADGPVDGRRTAVPQVPRLLSGTDRHAQPVQGLGADVRRQQAVPGVAGTAVVVPRPDRRHPQPDPRGGRRQRDRHEDDAAFAADERRRPARHRHRRRCLAGRVLHEHVARAADPGPGRSARTAPRRTSRSSTKSWRRCTSLAMQPGATLAVFVDPQNPVDMAIDWIRTGQLGPPPPGSTPVRVSPGHARSSAADRARRLLRVSARA